MKNLYLALILTIFSFSNIQSQCTYAVELYDTFGDGWNGGSLTIKVNGVSVLTGLTIASGAGPEYFPFDVNTGDVITAVYTAGTWPEENQYIVYDGDNIQIFTDGGDGSAPSATANIGTANCSACPTPSVLGVTNVGDTQVTLQWGSTATEWNIEWGNDGFTPGGGTLINTTDHPYILTGLTASTSYDFYVQAVCGPGLTSTWAGPFTFTTGACPADDICTYNLNMTDAGNSWNGANINVLQDGVSLGTFTVSGGGANYATVDICEGSLIQLVWSSGAYDNECIFEMTDPYGNVIYSFPQGGAPDPGTFFSFTSTCVPPACPSPLNLNAFNITDVSAQLSWNEPGDAAMWNIEYGASGFTPGTGVDISHITVIPYTLTGLIPGMTYSFYVQSDCDADGTSMWVGPFTFTMGNPPLDNPSACELGYEIPDNDCEEFVIEVDGVGGTVLGTDCYVKEVRLIATHTFDQDLMFTLTSPNGVSVVLSQQHGGGGDNYGVIDGTCTQYTSFKMDALTAISMGTAPFNGEFIPDGDFADFNDGTDPNGMWSLEACDLMNTDFGTLEFVHILFGTFGTEAEILSYSFPDQTGPATIDPVERTIDVEVDWEADLTNLVANFTLSTGASAEIAGIEQTSGLTANNFTSPVTYTVIAEDGITSHDWVINVTLAEMPQGAICSWPLPLTLPVYGETGTTEGFGDDYNNTMTCSSNFMNGDDIVYEFSLPVNGTLSGTMTASINWIGMFVTSGCPDAGGACVISKTSTGTTAAFSNQPIAAGTYFLILSNYAPPQNMDFEFDLVFTPDPSSVDLGVLSPAEQIMSCNFGTEELISMCVVNTGGMTIPTGDTIYIGYNVEPGTPVFDTIILESDLETGDSVCHIFNEFYDFSAIGEYEVNVWFEYDEDMASLNNSVSSTYVQYVPEADFVCGDTAETTTFPFTIELSDVYSSYYWYNASETVTSTAMAFDVDEYGWYYVDLIDENGCEFTDSVLVTTPVNIENINLIPEIRIYPNPNKGEFNLVFESKVATDVEVEVTDVCGRIMAVAGYSNALSIDRRISVSDVAPGVYFVNVSAAGHSTVVKMIVQ